MAKKNALNQALLSGNETAVQQPTIFLENRTGRLKAISKNLHGNNIDIRAFTIQDRGDCGRLRLILDRPSDACLALTDVGCRCTLEDGELYNL